MKRAIALLCVVCVLAACSSGAGAAEAELGASTFLVEVAAADLEVVGRDRLANTGEENRLDVLRPGGSTEIVTIYSGTPVPEPFEFVRDPLSSGGIDSVLAESERLIAVLFPLIDPTPGGRVLTGSLIGFGPGGNLVYTDWDEGSFEAVSELLVWGAEQGFDPLDTLELAVRGLGGSTDADATTAANFLR